MGLILGVGLGIVGILMLFVPFVIDWSVSRKQTNKTYKQSLEASVALIALGVLFMIGGILIVGFSSGKKVVSAGVSSFEGKFEGEKAAEARRGDEPRGEAEKPGGDNNALLTYLLLKQRGEGGTAEAKAEEAAAEGETAAAETEGLAAEGEGLAAKSEGFLGELGELGGEAAEFAV